jgi:hypothetical protein
MGERLAMPDERGGLTRLPAQFAARYALPEPTQIEPSGALLVGLPRICLMLRNKVTHRR